MEYLNLDYLYHIFWYHGTYILKNILYLVLEGHSTSPDAYSWR